MTGQYPAEDDFLDSNEDFDVMGPAESTILGMTPVQFGIVIGVLGILIAIILVFVQIRPLLQQIDSTEQDIGQKQDTLDQTQQQIQALAGIEDDLEQSRRFSAEVGRLLPDPDNIDTQLLEINRLVVDSDGQLERFEPAPLTASSVDQTPEVPTAIAPRIQVQSSAVGVQGGYDSLVNLMSNIERLETLLPVQDIVVTVPPAIVNEPTQSDGLTAEFSVRAYIYDETVPLPIPSAPEDTEAEPGT